MKITKYLSISIAALTIAASSFSEAAEVDSTSKEINNKAEKNVNKFHGVSIDFGVGYSGLCPMSNSRSGVAEKLTLSVANQFTPSALFGFGELCPT